VIIVPMTPEERRRKDADRKRNQRAKDRAAREAAKAAVADARNASATQYMTEAVERSLAAMKWLTRSDDAAVSQVRKLAMFCDRLEDDGDYIRALSAHRALTSALQALGANPIVRQQHELRSLRAVSRTSGGSDDGDRTDQQPEGAIVSNIKRPPKRRAR
jgi:hypothetical protein